MASWRLAIAQIQSKPGAVLGISRRCTHLGPFGCGLIALRLHIEENAFLQRVRSVAAQKTQINAIGCRGLPQSPEGRSSISMQLHSRLGHDQFCRGGFWIGEMAEQSAIIAGAFLNPLHHDRRWRKSGQERWTEQHGAHSTAEDEQRSHHQAWTSTGAAPRRTRSASDRDVIPAGATRRNGTSHSIDAVL